MKSNEKFSALIDAYIELAQNHHYDDSQIFDSLTDIFDENELVELGFGDFVHNYFHDSEEVRKPVSFLDISKVVYELYKQNWIDQHTTPFERLQSIREYFAYVQECREESVEPDSYEGYLEDYGFSGSLYACYDEFCDTEYHDVGYIKHLLRDEETLLKQYYEDVDYSFGCSEDLSVVAEVLSAAESRYVECAAHDNVEIEQMLD